MKKGEAHNNPSFNLDDFEKIQDNSKISWTKSKGDIWAAMDSKLDEPILQKTKVRALSVFQYAAAAVIVLLIGVAGVLRFYSERFETLPGEHLTVNLPDGSVVEMNAGTSFKYYPYWWKIERKMVMEGEAFFDVEKGNKFVVKSSNGKTRVLGTSFNIYSRNSDYRVNCITGKVQVTASNNKVVLMPNEQAVLKAGKINIKKELEEKASIQWIDGTFFFTSVPLTKAIEEIERQYGIKVLIELPKELNYTGNFSRDITIEETLYKVCKPLGVHFVKKKEGVYQIIQNN